MFRILHLSDLHIRQNTTWSSAPILSNAKRIICDEANEENIDVVAFTGDIAFSGKAEEYEIAANWLDDLCLQPTGLNLDAKGVMFVPGNHDADRSKISLAANAIEETLKTASEQSHIAKYYKDPESMALLAKRHSAYFEFCKSFTGLPDLSQSSWTRIFDHGGNRIRFDGFNTSWLCRGDDDHQRLLIGQPQLSEILDAGDEADVAIAMAHHPLSDLKDFDEKNTVEHLRQHHDILLRGHLHNFDPVSVVSGSGQYLEVSAGALHDRHESPNRFCIIDIPNDLETVSIKAFIWHGGRWIHDRNTFDTENGIGVFPLRRVARQKATSVHSTEGTPTEDSDDSSSVRWNALADTSGKNDENDDVLGSFPRHNTPPSRQDQAIRQVALAEAMSAIGSYRHVNLRKDSGAKCEGFIGCIAKQFQIDGQGAQVLYANCKGVDSGEGLQDILSMNARESITNLAVALRGNGRTMLVLDDLDDHSDGESAGTSVNDIVSALLDFCESLVVVRVSALPLPGDTIRIGALDAPDTRAYLENAAQPVSFDSTTDFARVHRVTSGLPLHLDAVVDALSVTDLDGALAQVDAESVTVTTALPQTIAHEINGLREVQEPEFERIRRLLWTLSILERGESLHTIKRLDRTQPIWPKHASYLEKKGCLDIVEANPAQYDTELAKRLGRSEKILRVPRMVRDHVVAIMSKGERQQLTEACAQLYFGSDWRLGLVRMRRRLAFSSEISTHQSGNEMTVLRALALEPDVYFAKSGASPFDLGLSYVSQLRSKSYYGEAYEAGRELLGIAASSDPIAAEKLLHLQRLTGACARMIGDREACVEILVRALPSVRSSREKKVLCDVLIDLALALKGLGDTTEAASIAEEIIQITPRESSDYFQAKAILAEAQTDGESRMTELKRLAARARNLEHHTVADNIVLEIVTESDDTEEKLKLLSDVKARGEREYNYVRATIRRVETLLDANRSQDVTRIDERDLWRSYSLTYSQRLSGIFDWCHRVWWRYLSETGQQLKLLELFAFSSFVWRLSGNVQTELKYAKILVDKYSDTNVSEDLSMRLLAYCRTRCLALEHEPVMS